MASELQERVEKYLLWAVTLCTVAMWATLRDPFNIPKLTFLALLAVPIGYILLWKRFGTWTKLSLGASLPLSFTVLGLLISFLFSDQHFQSLWGVHGRNNGLISYLALVVLFLAGTQVRSEEFNIRLLKCVVVLGVIVCVYATAQSFGFDFSTNLRGNFNPAFTTFGNPNFTAGFLGISASALLIKNFDVKGKGTRFFGFIIWIGILLVIWRTQSIQGIGATIGGVAAVMTILMFRKKRLLGVLFLASILIVTVMLSLSFMGRGPLGQVLRQRNLEVRINYWRAALKMMTENPWAGVGLDRFGSFFWLYRDIASYRDENYVLTDAAHNTFLQLGAVGGLPLFIGYVFLQVYIAVYCIRKLILLPQFNFTFAAIFASWVAFQVQSFVSIDNLGLAAWGWALGGVLLSKNAELDSAKSKKSHLTDERTFPIRGKRVVLIGAAMAAISAEIFLVSNIGSMWRADDKIRRVVAIQSLRDADEQKVITLIEDTIGHRPKDAFYPGLVAGWLGSKGALGLADEYAQRALLLDGRSERLLEIRAEIARMQQRPEDEELHLQEALTLDPLNARLQIRLAQLALLLRDDKVGAEALLVRAANGDPTSSQADQARQILEELRR